MTYAVRVQSASVRAQTIISNQPPYQHPLGVPGTSQLPGITTMATINTVSESDDQAKLRFQVQTGSWGADISRCSWMFQLSYVAVVRSRYLVQLVSSKVGLAKI